MGETLTKSNSAKVAGALKWLTSDLISYSQSPRADEAKRRENEVHSQFVGSFVFDSSFGGADRDYCNS